MQCSFPDLYITENHHGLLKLSELVREMFTVTRAAETGTFFVSDDSSISPDVIATHIINQDEARRYLPKIANNTAIVVINGTESPDILFYQYGADVVFNPDVQAETLLIWLQRKFSQIKAMQQVKLDAETASQAATIAMTNAGELGRAIHFIENTFELHSPYGLSNGLFHLLRSMAIKASISFRWNNGDIDNFSSETGNVPEDEQAVFRDYRDNGRIIDFGSQTLINFPKVSLLIKNMPLENQEHYGRLKDLMPIILGSVNEKAELIDSEKASYESSCETVQAFHHFRNTIFKLAKTQNDHVTRAMQELIDMKQRIFQRLPELGLDAEQDRYIESILEEALDKVATSFQLSGKHTAGLLMTVEDVRALSARLEDISNSFAPKIEELEQTAEYKANPPAEFNDDDIELF